MLSGSRTAMQIRHATQLQFLNRYLLYTKCTVQLRHNKPCVSPLSAPYVSWSPWSPHVKQSADFLSHIGSCWQFAALQQIPQRKTWSWKPQCCGQTSPTSPSDNRDLVLNYRGPPLNLANACCFLKLVSYSFIIALPSFIGIHE